MNPAPESSIENPRRLSAKLCGAIALALVALHLVVALQSLASRRTELVQLEARALERVLAAIGPEPRVEALQSRMADLQGSGITSLRLVEKRDAELHERSGELVYRSGGVEVQASLAGLERELRAHGWRLAAEALLSLFAACGVAWWFVMRSRAIQAAERVDVYARRLERQNEELLEAKRRAESADRAKTEFLANVSHELRTPLTAILGFTDVMIEKASSGAESSLDLDDARTIQRNSHYLYRLLAGLLDFANLEAGRLRIDWGACSPADILRDVETVSRTEAEEKRLRLRTELADDVPDAITSDATRIRQILLQLIDNAVKFTDDGSVTLRLTTLREGYAQPQVAFDVIDTGIGMTETQLAGVFESFSQGDGSRSRRHGGLGLGLALGRRLARKLQGDITVVSTPLEGSAFRLMLPLAPLEDDDVALAADDGARIDPEAPLDCRVLVAEDGADNRKLIEHILNRAGAQVTMVDDGREAVELALQAWREDAPFDVIVMDMQMPETDGISATRTLRLENYSGAIIALTADARPANREECLRAGCDEFLPKPIETNRLLATIHSLVKRPV